MRMGRSNLCQLAVGLGPANEAERVNDGGVDREVGLLSRESPE
jgi:hypothetical protein